MLFRSAESLLADEEFTITVGRTFDGLSMPRLDSIEVYGLPKPVENEKHVEVAHPNVNPFNVHPLPLVSLSAEHFSMYT